MKVKKEDSQLVFNEYIKVRKLKINEEGSRYTRYIVDRQDAASIVLYNPSKETVVLVKQFRAPVMGQDDPYLLELPAGVLEEGEEGEKAIIRETREETGYHINSAQYVTTFFTSAGYSTERCQIWYAEVTEDDQSEEGGGLDEENENLQILELPLSELTQMLERQELVDGKTIIGLYWLLRKLGC